MVSSTLASAVQLRLPSAVLVGMQEVITRETRVATDTRSEQPAARNAAKCVSNGTQITRKPVLYPESLKPHVYIRTITRHPGRTMVQAVSLQLLKAETRA